MDVPQIPHDGPDEIIPPGGAPVVHPPGEQIVGEQSDVNQNAEGVDSGPFEIVVIREEAEHVNLRPIAIASLLSALMATAITVGALFAFGAFDVEPARIETIIQQPAPAATGADIDIVSVVAEQAIPSIVTVHRFDDFPEFGPAGSGSGVVLRSDGYILTNDHVITGADNLKVVFADGLTYPATLVGTDPLMDIAVLKVGVEGLRPIPFADLTTASIGDLAIAVGNPLGLDGGPSVTSGVISAFDRTLGTNGLGGPEQLFGLLQTDAPITRGSSGGALLNRSGQLIGITTAIGLSDVGAEGLGFAVPVNLVEGIANDLINTGSVEHAFLGIQGAPAFIERADGSEVPQGATIGRLLDSSALGDAGAEVGDVIVALDGTEVNSMILLVARLRSYRAGETITVTVLRDGVDIDITLVLDQYRVTSG